MTHDNGNDIAFAQAIIACGAAIGVSARVGDRIQRERIVSLVARARRGTRGFLKGNPELRTRRTAVFENAGVHIVGRHDHVNVQHVARVVAFHEAELNRQEGVTGIDEGQSRLPAVPRCEVRKNQYVTHAGW